MYSKYLKSFVLAADLKSFNKAAAALHVSPTAIMRQMDVLEEKLGLHLLARTNHGVGLTKSGQFFYREAKSMMQHCDEIVEAAQKLQKEEATA